VASKDQPAKKRRIRKVAPTVRQQAAAAAEPKREKRRRIKKVTGKASRPIRAAYHFGKKEVYLPMPDNKIGRFLNKRRSFIPRYFKESWQELRKVTWPNRKETTKLTLAVFTFAIVFGLLVAIVDFGLDRLFRKIFLD
jgi:preprotein translocase subunit SecE